MSFGFYKLHLVGNTAEEYQIIDDSESPEHGQFLTGLSKVNIFVGPTNTGKSRFMREIIKTVDESVHILWSTDDLAELDRLVRDLKRLLRNSFINQSETRFSYLSKDVQRVAYCLRDLLSSQEYLMPSIINSPVASPDPIRKFLDLVNGLLSDEKISSNQGLSNDVHKIYRGIVALSSTQKNHREDQHIERIYIPILRGLKRVTIEERDLYHENTLLHYGKFEKCRCFTGQFLYRDIRGSLLGNRTSRDAVRDFEKFLSRNFFHGKELVITPMEASDLKNQELHIAIADGEDRKIYDVGDGVGAIINLLYPIYLNKDKRTIFFIEEPELYMHPGLQRLFLEQLLSLSNQHQYFITTHSNHLLDIAVEQDGISIFSFSSNKDQSGGIVKKRIVPNPPERLGVLADLGVRASSVFRANCLIWVEGITDRLVVERLMDLVRSDDEHFNFQLDIHYSIVEYGGANIEHLDFCGGHDGATPNDERAGTVAISSAASFVLMDGDTLDCENAKDKRCKKILDNLGDSNAMILGGGKIKCEIENTFSTEGVGKMNLGQTLDTQVRGYYDSVPGFVKNKVKFTRAFLEVTKDIGWGAFTAEGKRLADKLKAFIQGHNK